VTPTRIVLADDHTLIRAGLRTLLGRFPDMTVVAEAGDGWEALRAIEQTQPDVALMDIMMPGLNGLDATARVTARFPHVRVIIVSMHLTEELILRALDAGAAGYLLKDARAPELELAIQAVLRGEIYLSPAVSKRVVDYVRSASAALGRREVLTPRQREILQLVAEGRTVKEIAQTLGISPKTAEMHRAQVMERLDIHNVAGLVRYAIQTGLVAPD
jgi:DNA-binding NarL/FixJ family response regulator